MLKGRLPQEIKATYRNLLRVSGGPLGLEIIETDLIQRGRLLTEVKRGKMRRRCQG